MYRNSEHYPDPTAGIALARIAREEHRAQRKAQKKVSQPANRKPPAQIPDNRRRHLAWTSEYDSISSHRRLPHESEKAYPYR